MIFRALYDTSKSSIFCLQPNSSKSVPKQALGPKIYYVAKNWVDGFRKWQFLLAFSTVFMLADIVGGGSEKAPEYANII